MAVSSLVLASQKLLGIVDIFPGCSQLELAVGVSLNKLGT